MQDTLSERTARQIRFLSPEPASDSDSGPGADSDSGPGADSDSGPGADSDSGPGGDHQLGNKTGFPPRTWPYPHAVPSALAFTHNSS